MTQLEQKLRAKIAQLLMLLVQVDSDFTDNLLDKPKSLEEVELVLKEAAAIAGLVASDQKHAA